MDADSTHSVPSLLAETAWPTHFICTATTAAGTVFITSISTSLVHLLLCALDRLLRTVLGPDTEARLGIPLVASFTLTSLGTH